MRLAYLLPLFIATPALAHPGHIADVAGHDHIIAGIALGVAAGVALWGALKGRKGKSEEVAEPVDEAEIDTEAEVA